MILLWRSSDPRPHKGLALNPKESELHEESAKLRHGVDDIEVVASARDLLLVGIDEILYLSLSLCHLLPRLSTTKKCVAIIIIAEQTSTIKPRHGATKEFTPPTVNANLTFYTILLSATSKFVEIHGGNTTRYILTNSNE